MFRLRSVWAALAAASFCAALQGAVLAKIAPQTGWPAAVTVLLAFTLPPALVLGVVVAVFAPRSPRQSLAGAALGAAVYLVPTSTTALRLPAFELVSWLLLAGATVAAVAWARRTAPDAGPAGGGPLGHLGLAAGGGGLLLGVLGVLLPGPDPPIGRMPPAGELPAPRLGERQPNLALIVLDTLRADRLGSYGYARRASPFLDEFAAEGLRFEQAVAPSSHTPPSHASLFTGLMPSEHGVMSSHVGMPLDDRETLAQRLSEGGYTTVGVVANFAIRRAQRFGAGFHRYDDSLVCLRGLSAASEAVARLTGPGRLFGLLPIRQATPLKLLLSLLRPRSDAARADQVNSLAARHLEAAAERGGPVFLFLNYMDVHSPYSAPGEDRDRFLEHEAGPFAADLGSKPFHDRLRDLATALRSGEPVEEEWIAALGDRYDGELAYLDRHLRELVAVFREHSGDRPWQIVITSDHGEHFGEHQELGHGQALWEETQRVPLLVVGSGVPPGVVSEPVSLLDVPATLLACAGEIEPMGHGRLLPGIPGEALPESSRAAALATRAQGPRLLAAEHGDTRARRVYSELQQLVVYADGWKGHFTIDEASGRLEFERAFDLRSDPGESLPLEQAALPGSFAAWSAAWLRRYAEGRERSRAVGDQAAAERRLAELGYL